MGLVADPSGSPGPVQADSIAVGSAVGAFTLSNLPSIQHFLSPEFLLHIYQLLCMERTMCVLAPALFSTDLHM